MGTVGAGNRTLFEHGQTLIWRCVCAGASCSGQRDTSEREHLAVTQRGRFGVRHRRGRLMFDPTCTALFRSSDDYQTEHPDGGDVGLCISHPALLARLEPWQPVRLSVQAQMSLHRLAARLASEELDVLEVDEAVMTAFDLQPAPRRSTARARALADELSHEVAARFDEPLPLTELSGRVGLSPFAATRLFRAATGFTIHEYQVELRLRHALALLYETDRSLAAIAVDTGFANQGHFGNHFRRRFGLPPGRARRPEGLTTLLGLLAADPRSTTVDSRKEL